MTINLLTSHLAQFAPMQQLGHPCPPPGSIRGRTCASRCKNVYRDNCGGSYSSKKLKRFSIGVIVTIFTFFSFYIIDFLNYLI